MDYNAYEILGLPDTATREEVDQAYKKLRDKYQKDRFKIGEEGEEAAENLQRIEVAYRDIIAALEEQANPNPSGNDYSSGSDYSTGSDYSSDNNERDYQAIQQLIRQDRLDEAQSKLDAMPTRTAEWHYLQSIVFYKRNWFLESKKQLEFALELEPNNTKYRDSLDKLDKILASHTISADQLRNSSRPTNGGNYNVGADNGTCTGSLCLDCMLCNACCNCMQCMS